MGFTINIDIGGTFTDFFAAQDYEKTEVRITKRLRSPSPPAPTMTCQWGS